MKKSFRLTTLFTLIAGFILSLLVSISLCITPVKAASAGGIVFEMEYGASVKLSGNGLRFKVKMDEGYYDYITQNDDVELYGYIAPVQEFDKTSNYEDLSVKVGGVLDEGKIYEEDGFYWANMVITDLDEYTSGGTYLYAQSFSAIAIIKDMTGGSAQYIYADMAKDDTAVSNIEAQNRTQYQVINAAFLDGDKSYESSIIAAYGDWYGTEKYPILIQTEADYNAFVAKIENAAFKAKVEGKHVFVKEGLNVDVTSKVNVTQKTGHIVTFYDGNKVVDVQFVANDGDTIPPTITQEGYNFVEWVGATTDITQDENVYAKWKFSKGEVQDLGGMKVYGVTLANGNVISNKNSLIGEMVVLSSGYLGDGAYYPNETGNTNDPTDEKNTADQAYLAYDGNYGFDDYFVVDFTGKNMPTVAFFANNYNNSIFYGDGTKNGVVVSTGLTWPDGRLFTEGAGSDGKGPYCTSVWDGKGLAMWGPHMIYSTAKNASNTSNGVLLHANESDVALGRANLVDNTKYRVIMGMQPGDDASNKAIKLVYNLYDLDTGAIIESKAINTYNFFADGWANAGQTRDQYCQGSIVLYGHFGTTTVLDKTYDIYEDTTLDAVAEAFGFGLENAYNSTIREGKVVLSAGSIGGGANYTKGQQNDDGDDKPSYVDQSYFALDGNYGLNDYIAFNFTGKNMPEIAFFAKNYNNSMYAEGTSKQGIVVVTGITTYNGGLDSGVNGNGTQINYGFPYMIQDAANGGFIRSSFKTSALGRANLVDGKHYRVIMGFEGKNSEGTNGITLHWYLYDIDTATVVEQASIETWNFFTGSNAQVGNMTVNDLSGSIVLYSKFGVDCTIDKLYGVFEDTDIDTVANIVSGNTYTVTFNNYDGSELATQEYAYGETPVYSGTPIRREDGVASYAFAGWDKEITKVAGDVTYTATYNAVNIKEGITISGNSGHTYGVTIGDKVVLKKSNLGNNANYHLGQQNAEGAYVHQSYLAFDGNYALNDYVALDFTGKNLPEIAFFAKNYNDSMYAEGTSKQGIVVVTGITTWDGQLSSGVNGNGTKINYGYPYMIQNAADGGFVDGALRDSALGRANLVDGKHYRVIMGFTGSGSAITLHWYLYDLDAGDAGAVVEQSSMTTWNFFTGSNDKVGNMTINDLSGSIVLYGKFGVECTLDTVYGVFEDTDIDTVAKGLLNHTTTTVKYVDEDGSLLQQETVDFGVASSYKGETPTKEATALYQYAFSGWQQIASDVEGEVVYQAVYEKALLSDMKANNATFTNEGIILNNSSIGDSAHYSGSNNQSGVVGTVNQSYLAFDGNGGYGFNDYVVFDFTGKNMPSVAFFANNYNESMYYQNGEKYGLVVLTGLTTWQGELYTEYNDSKSVYDGKGLLVCGPYMLHNTLSSGKNGVLGFQAVSSNSGKNSNVALGRANLDASKQYRVIMGMEAGNHAASVKIVYALYNVTDGVIVEQFAAETYNFFTNGFAKDGQTREEYCQGSIVLYGHFGTTTTLDKVWGVYEDTTLEKVVQATIGTNDSGSGEGGDTPVSNAPDYSKYTDQFDFYAYSCYSDGTYEIDGVKYYIGKNLANLKQYSLYGGVGMTIYFPQSDCLVDGSAESIAKAKALIDDLAKVGITKTILQDNRILYLSMRETAIVGDGCLYATEDALDEYIYNCVKDYATYAGVYGIQLGDEPKYSMLSAYSAVYKSIKRVNAKYGFNLFIQYNLNPLNVTEEVYDNYYPASSGTYEWNNYRYKLGLRDRYTDCVARYKQYIDDFLNAMQPDSIMYDDYPLRMDKNGNLQVLDTYIPCLQIVAKAAADRNIKFYNVTQAHKNNADGEIHKRAVTEAGANWMNNILLGFGAKQIAYYTYYTRAEADSTGGESYVDGQSFVDYNGNPTALYSTMQGILANNQKFAPTIMQFEYKGSKVIGYPSSVSHLKKITVSNSFTKLSDCSVNTGSALITELYDDENGNYMYMAMNVLDPDATATEEKVSMTFNGYTHVLVYRNGVATEVELSGGVYTVTLTNGEAVYVIPYNN